MAVRNLVLLLLVTCALVGCTSTALKIPGAPIQADEKALGEARGKATGIMLFQLIPIGQNTRFEAAYARALASQPGATRLTDVTIREKWFWAWVLNG
jgi:hypothetical protein